MAEWIEFDSSMIGQARYSDGVLEVVFKTNPFWVWHFEIDVEIWEGLLEADSSGKYFRRHLGRMQPVKHILLSESE